MNTISMILQRVLDTLCQNDAFSGADLVLAYPKGFKRSPLTRPTVAVGVSGVEMEPGGFSGYCGEEPGTGREIYARRANLRIRLDAYLPQLGEGTDSFIVFTNIADALLEGEFGGALLEIECSDLTWNQQAAAYLLPVTVKIQAMLGSGQPQGTAIDEIIVKGMI